MTQSPSHRGFLYPSELGELASPEHFAKIRVAKCPARVRSLLQARGPLAVAGRIRAVVINPVKGQPFWSLAHVAQECAETVRLAPFSTDHDSTATVAGEMGVSTPIATRQHPAPDLVCARFRKSVGGVVKGSRSAVNLASQASARPSPILKLVAANDLHGSTVAATFPSRVFAGKANVPDHRKAAKNLAGEICYRTSHASYLNSKNRSLAENYGICRADQLKLRELQDWISEQQKVR